MEQTVGLLVFDTPNNKAEEKVETPSPEPVKKSRKGTKKNIEE